MGFEELITSGVFAPLPSGPIGGRGDGVERYLALNPSKVKVEVVARGSVEIVVAYTSSQRASIEVDVADGGAVSLTELYLADTFASVAVRLGRESRSKVVSAVLCNASASYEVSLAGDHSEAEFDGVFMADGSQHAMLSLTTRHLVADCRSRSLVKGVASGRATGEFRGLVYVAPDAQRTDAEQQKRNIELGGGRIRTLPQVEIYADDVRCSHGATIGQTDDEALYYMRQRGLSESDARRLLLEGFVRDITARCGGEGGCDLLAEAVDQKLDKM